ncbi:MAG TPA: radical SAM protein [Anaerolineales bacterium]|nr:radical SAM protein [Anaerolineales bacterium]
MDSLTVLAEAMQWEVDTVPPATGRPDRGRAPCGASSRPHNGRESSVTDAKGRQLPIYQASGPGGRRFPLLKAMLTTACERDCHYCAFRAGRSMRRATFKPEEMANAFDDLRRAGQVEGLFLSTGILGGGPNTQNRLIDTTEILRRQGFGGYIHLKIMPGVERGQVERAMRLANRVSLNLEGPSAGRLEGLAPHKDFERELLAPLLWMEEIRKAAPGAARPSSSATQFVVGAGEETDVEILSMTERLYRQAGLSRAYFSAFDPLPDTPLENHPAENPLREHRLYQASYLLRDYGFGLEDLPFDRAGRLPLDRDPKQAYAEAHLSHAPVEVNRGSPEELRRVPGFGPASVERLLSARRVRRLRHPGQLRALGILAERAAPYILLDGKRPPLQGRLAL